MTSLISETATIANGASLSGEVNLEHGDLFALIMPAAWTAAVLTFSGSYDGTTFYNLYDETGTEISFTVDASRYVLISAPAKFMGLKRLKVRSGTAGAAVNQAAERAITLLRVPEA